MKELNDSLFNLLKNEGIIAKLSRSKVDCWKNKRVLDYIKEHPFSLGQIVYRVSKYRNELSDQQKLSVLLFINESIKEEPRVDNFYCQLDVLRSLLNFHNEWDF